jgi:hypothetical protein
MLTVFAPGLTDAASSVVSSKASATQTRRGACVFPRAAVHACSNGSNRHRSFAAGPFDVSVAEILLKNWVDGRH